MESKTATFQEVTYAVQGMSCGSCVRHLKAALEGNAGIEAVEVNLAAGKVTVSYIPQTTQPDAIAEAIRKIGYTPDTSIAE